MRKKTLHVKNDYFSGHLDVNPYFFYKFSPNLLNGLICEARARAKQILLRMSWPLQSNREIPGNRQNLETKV